MIKFSLKTFNVTESIIADQCQCDHSQFSPINKCVNHSSFFDESSIPNVLGMKKVLTVSFLKCILCHPWMEYRESVNLWLLFTLNFNAFPIGMTIVIFQTLDFDTFLIKFLRRIERLRMKESHFWNKFAKGQFKFWPKPIFSKTKIHILVLSLSFWIWIINITILFVVFFQEVFSFQFSALDTLWGKCARIQKLFNSPFTILSLYSSYLNGKIMIK